MRDSFFLIRDPRTKNVAWIFLSFSISSIARVLVGCGPSSKVMLIFVSSLVLPLSYQKEETIPHV